MKKFLLASVAVAAIAAAGSAGAADLPVYKAQLPVVPVWSWTGFYIGANAGWIGSTNNSVANTGTDTDGGGLGTALNLGILPNTVNLSNSGFIGGGQIGYNSQISTMWVWGFEADLDWVNAKSSTTVVFPGSATVVPLSTSYNRELDWLGTFRGRIGITPAGPFLLYATGGLAYGQDKIGNAFSCRLGCVPPPSTQAGTINTNSNTAVGWTVGGGAEWVFAPQWSFKAEHLYVDLGSHSSTITYAYGPGGAPLPLVFNSSLTSTVRDVEQIVRIGVNYKFDWGGPVVANY